jgi:hypothetical protein|tara:strand:+ start:377746 stop:378081 length:336 start_codon:yes stop_codon:yes gene_type:complete
MPFDQTRARAVLVLLLAPRADAEDRLRAVRAGIGDARIVLLTSPAAVARLSPLADEVWSEGLAHGPARFLALVRRISWMEFAAIYDCEGSFMTRFLRFCVWPRPKWCGFRP